MTTSDSHSDAAPRSNVPITAGDTAARDRGRLLGDVIGAFADATTDYDHLLAVVSRMLAEAVGDFCSVLLLSEDRTTLQVVATHDPDPDVLAFAREVFSNEPFAIVPAQQRVLDTGEAFVAPHITPERTRGITTDKRAAFTERIGMHSVLLVALRARGEPIGVLNLVRHRPERAAYDDRDRDIAQQLADHAAVAIANARVLRRHHDELRKARDDAEAAAHELRLANEAISAANRELEAFAYTVAHDLKAPLRAIDGFTGALEEEHLSSLDADGRRYLRHVRVAARRMANLIEDLLRLSRIAQAPLERSSVDLTQIAHEIAAELRSRSPERRVQVRVTDGLIASGDPHLVRIVLENLLANAWKFTARRDDAEIEVGRDDVGSFVVRDNGAGFDPACVDRLFIPFQRLHADTDFEGTGVGLATVHRIVERHGGRIRAESGPGQGATFRFTLG